MNTDVETSLSKALPKAPVLIDGEWREADASGFFQAQDPATTEWLPVEYPVSTWADCDEALSAAAEAFAGLREAGGSRIAGFLELYASELEAHADELVEIAHVETGLPRTPRLRDIELPRTINQLKAAADAARCETWRNPVIDTVHNLRSCLGPIGPVCVFGPNNFAFAFNGAAGGDFAAAVAAGNPVIAKANSGHPGTSRRLAEIAFDAIRKTGLPEATLQLIYRTSHAVGALLVSDPRLGATGYTGSRKAGLTLKKAADDAGKPIYLELSSVNPVIFLPGILGEDPEVMARTFADSCLLSVGQFCTNPGLVLLVEGDDAERFVTEAVAQFESREAGVLLSAAVRKALHESHRTLIGAGARVCCGTGDAEGGGFRVANTLFRVSGAQFLTDPEQLQTEAFGNSSLVVVADSVRQIREILEHLEGSLTGSIYSSNTGSDDDAHAILEPALRRKVGRLLNDKMPTGVLVSPAMNHGGPYPATGHPVFTAVGLPAAIQRFTMLQCYDQVRSSRLPAILTDDYEGGTQRCIDGRWV